ncbi:MmgE/PrpD family protein [Sphingomonas crocodyli]|uniref:MmgE/PrpD N-terminal domain-containing protein n=1 Tax=Sphingomonas crocodyli TaxID=1979270 RepID=A0A437M7C7_9SPHN|nr:MmgE/PrpD family protein [Sphingomonas crocodyli]RVT93537.1 hypothetical protein EOD43_06615 [Sphingomonas crocodyli]
MPDEKTVIDQLISNIEQFRFGDWAPDISHRASLCLLDSLACYSAGRSLNHFAPIAHVADQLFNIAASQSDPSAFVMAYLYGSAANLLDYDDTLGSGHPGAAIVGAVLAVAAKRQLSIDQLLRGIAAGYQTEWLLGMASAPTAQRAALVRGVGAWDTVAASVGISVALGVGDDILKNTLGLAVAHSVIPYTAKWYERPVPSLKNNLGWMGAGAVLASELALKGKTGVTNALEGDNGMWRMVGSDRFDLDPSLFERPAVLRVGFKAYPACWHLQAYLKAFDALLKASDANDEVAEIVVRGPKDVEKFCNPNIQAPTDTAFSLPAAFSLLQSGIEPGPRWVEYGDDDAVFRHRDLFRFELSEDRSVELRLRDGRHLRETTSTGDMRDLAPSGLSETALHEKYARLTAPELQAATTAALFDAPSNVATTARFYEAFRKSIASSVDVA